MLVAPWLTFNFHVGLVCSLTPEQEGPGGVGVCVCVFACVSVCARVCVCEPFGKLKLVSYMLCFSAECVVARY